VLTGCTMFSLLQTPLDASTLPPQQESNQPPLSRSQTEIQKKSAAAPADPNPQTQPTGFSVTQFLVEGNTLLSADKIEEVLEKHKGQGRTMEDLENARSALEKTYNAAGYPTVLVNIPEQTIDEGIVKLQVIEGRLGAIKVTGNEHFNRWKILEKLPSLKHGEVLYEPAFAKELAAVNAIPDLKVAPVLKPGDEPGLVNLELKVKDRLPVHGKLEGDNKGPITTPRNRLLAEIQHANLFGNNEILTVSTIQTPTDWGAVQNYGFSFVDPIIWPDHILALYASRSKSTSTLAGSALSVGGGDIAIAGNATVAGIRYMFPLTRSTVSTHQLAIGLDYKRLEETNAQFPGGLGSLTILSAIQYTPAFLGYTGTLPDSNGQTRLTASAKGYVAGTIPGGHESDFTGDPNDPSKPGIARKGVTGTFAVLQGGIDRVQFLPADFSLLIHVDGQWASEPLPPAELYFAGGMDTVRGYDNYQAVGDNAIRGRAELTSPELLSIPIDRFWQRKKSADWLFRIRGIAFFDVANLWTANPQPGQFDQFRLMGTGVGIRAKLPKDIGDLKVDNGWALRTSGVTQRGDTFVHFSVNIGF
jgi:hemolysin activation/secretion protein